MDWAESPTDVDTHALAGIRVLDLSRVLAGPYLTMLLGDLGADVIKVEHPAGDDTRQWGPPFHDGEATYFLAVNRNKRGMTADLANERDRAIVQTLASGADVVVENFRPGTADRLGVGFETLRRHNERLIYCSISGFGEARLPGYDLLVQATGGLMSVTGTTESGPVKVGVALVDLLAGMHGLAGILAALHHRERTGHGQRVGVTLLDTVLASLVNHAQGYLSTGQVPTLSGNVHPSVAPYQTLRAAAGHLAIAVGNDRQFRSLCKALDLPELADDERFATNTARVHSRANLVALLEGALADRDVDETTSALLAAGVPAGPVNNLAEAFAYAERLGREPVVRLSDGERTVAQVANPIRMSRTPPSYRHIPPRLVTAEPADPGDAPPATSASVAG